MKMPPVITAADEYKKNPGLKKEQMHELQEWLKSQPHLPPISELDQIYFLHSNYFDLDGAKNTIETYYTNRANYKEFFTNQDVFSPELKNAQEAISVVILPDITPEGYRVIFCKVRSDDINKFNFAECLKLFIMTVDLMLIETGTCEGIVVAFDMDGVVLGHLLRMGIFTVKHFMHYLQDGMPVRIRGLQFFNIVPFIDKILFLVKPFMKKSLFEMLMLHQSIEQTYDYIPAKLFPKDYPKGTAPLLNDLYEIYKNKHLHHRDALLEAEVLKKADDSKRIPKRRSLWNAFGAL